MIPGEWVEDAVCAQVDPDLFFPNEGDYHQARRAKELCQTCPVINECADYAIRAGIRDGIFGGLTPRERATARRRLDLSTGT